MNVDPSFFRRLSLKRLFDILVALIALFVLSPIFAFLFFQLRNKLGTPVFFRQARSGLRGRPFLMVKFRTMRDEIGDDGLPLPDSERVTPFGRFLRESSLDELPELWNVLKGDMSLVGPRPLLTQYLSLYSPQQARRHEVRPGITGWAQVNGRNAISWEEKFKLDVWYVDNSGFFLDMIILIKTLYKVFFRIGVTTKDGDPMPIFKGTHLSPNCHD